MKKLLFILTVATLTTSCIKEYNGSSNADDSGFTGSKSEVEDYFSPEVMDALEELGYKFNTGGNPPNIEGVFLGNQQKLKASNVPTDQAGMQFPDYTYTFSSQSSESIDFQNSYSGGTSSGTGCFISGNGNDFSIYVVTQGTSNGQQSKTAKALSGTLTSSGISDFMIALIMLDNYGNGGSNGGTLLENGEGRLIYESDYMMNKQ